MTTTLDPSDVHWRDDAKVIGLVGLAHAGSHFSHLLLPLMFPVFIQSFGLSYAELGLLMSVFFAVSGFGQASAGFLVDRVGARPVLFVAMGIFVAAAMGTCDCLPIRIALHVRPGRLCTWHSESIPC